MTSPHRIQLPSGFVLDMQPIEGGEITISHVIHKVSDFFLGTYPVTNEQYALFLNSYGVDRIKDGRQYLVAPYKWSVQKKGNSWEPIFGYEQYPIIEVTWFGAFRFCEWLTEELKKTESPLKIRLPSEAEWEYAARGGKRSMEFIFAGGNKLKELGWYEENSQGGTRPVGLLMPNELGLYDMSGNVSQWCENQRVRGGSWRSSSFDCQVWTQGWLLSFAHSQDLGFRVAGYLP